MEIQPLKISVSTLTKIKPDRRQVLHNLPWQISWKFGVWSAWTLPWP